ncbi:Uma2 family endonuclease [Baaleninema simplex]|uniref:Uma2 family endonuclease n=1 Tax=Baaleninema simplex TaxID=2862350 RepID=UPI000477B310|nr:Uma2 family endonuclease [Baaleninema simplex]
MIQYDPPRSPRETLPTMYDLPSEFPDEPGLPDTFHYDQPHLLDATFQPPNWESDRIFSGGDLNLYYDVTHPLWHKRPDWFAAVGVPRLYDGRDLRLSYVCWQEPAYPFVVVELLSPGTEDEDLGQTTPQPGKPPTKWQVYEQILRVPYYAVFSRYTDELRVFRLEGGRYEPVELVAGRVEIPEIELSLGLWRGSYRRCDRLWLRWLTRDGALIPSPSEQAITAERRATEAERRATEAERKAERLAAKLKELGIDPETLEG